MTFFTSWQLWQKLTFVSMAFFGTNLCTLLLGGARLFYNNRRLRRYVILTDSSTDAKAHSTVPLTRDIEAQGQGIPFGIRALERGVAVEGVWISPSPSVRSTRTNSLQGGRSDTTLALTTPRAGKDTLQNPAYKVGNVYYTGSTSARYDRLSTSATASTDSAARPASQKQLKRPFSNVLDSRQLGYSPVAATEPMFDDVPLGKWDGRFVVSTERPSVDDTSTSQPPSLASAKPVWWKQTPTPAIPLIHLASIAASASLPTPNQPGQNVSHPSITQIFDDGDLGRIERLRLHQVASMGQLVPRVREVSSSSATSSRRGHDDAVQSRSQTMHTSNNVAKAVSTSKHGSMTDTGQFDISRRDMAQADGLDATGVLYPMNMFSSDVLASTLRPGIQTVESAHAPSAPPQARTREADVGTEKPATTSEQHEVANLPVPELPPRKQHASITTAIRAVIGQSKHSASSSSASGSSQDTGLALEEHADNKVVAVKVLSVGAMDKNNRPARRLQKKKRQGRLREMYDGNLSAGSQLP
ncbi:hypothetical protein MRB53_037342 [Persea americana]|nr:hypothetical protein MRB53_037342 [Persea americana]